MKTHCFTRMLSVGSILADIRIEAPRVPERGGDVIGSAASISAGGGFNVLAAASRNGLKSAFAGRHGVGPFGDRIRADLAQENIAALLPPSPEGDSGFCLVLVEPDGERTFITSPGVEAELGERKLEDIPLEASDAVFISGYDLSYAALGPHIARWTASWRSETFLAIDPGPLVADIPDAVFRATLARADLFTLNRREGALLAGTDDLFAIAAFVRPRLSAKALLAIRDGAAGCFLFGAGLTETPVHVPAPPVRAVDTTGAGDAHTGALLAGLAAGLEAVATAALANAAAALSVTRRGSATAPTSREVNAFLAAGRNPEAGQKDEPKATSTMKAPRETGENAMTPHLNRRTFHALFSGALGAGLLTIAGSRRAGAAATEITVLNWKGYGTDEAFALKAFAEATGVTVKHDYFNAEAEMLTKLRTNPGAYDVVLINSARTQQVQADGLIDPVDLNAVPNAKDLAPALRDHSNIWVDGKPYGVAWLWGMTALAVRSGKVSDAQSWAVFSDPKYAGRLALFDDSITQVGIGALLTNQDPNNPKDLKAVTTALKAMKPNVKLTWSSEDEWNKAFAADAFDISDYWSGAAARSIKIHKLPLDFIVPKEGAIGWLDTLAVPTSSTKKPAALQFINYMIDPKFYVTWATQSGAPASTNAAAMNALPADDLSHKIYKPEDLAKLKFMSALPDDRRQAFNDVWDEVKAYYAK